VIYTAPVQIGPANPLYSFTTGYQASMWGIPDDDLDGWRGPYPPEVVAAQFEKMAEGFWPGIAALQLALQEAPPDRRKEVQGDLWFAQAAGKIFQSVANQARFIMAREALVAKQPWNELREQPTEGRESQLTEMKRCLESEIVLARQLFTIAREDSRIGFEPTCQYFYLPLDLVEKVVNCRWLLGYIDKQELGQSYQGSAVFPDADGGEEGFWFDRYSFCHHRQGVATLQGMEEMSEPSKICPRSTLIGLSVNAALERQIFRGISRKSGRRTVHELQFPSLCRTTCREILCFSQGPVRRRLAGATRSPGQADFGGDSHPGEWMGRISQIHRVRLGWQCVRKFVMTVHLFLQLWGNLDDLEGYLRGKGFRIEVSARRTETGGLHHGTSSEI
jgi:hypothetical protein